VSVTRNPLRIGITGHPNAGGSGVIAGELGRLLARRGHEVHFIAGAPPFRFSSFEEQVSYHEAGVAHYPMFRHAPYTLALAAKMAEVARRSSLDILHVHYALPHAPAALLALGMLGNGGRPKLVTTLHGTDVTIAGTDESLHEIVRYSIEASDAVTAVSRYLQTTAAGLFPRAADIECIPNFVDLHHYAGAADAALRQKLVSEEEVLLIHLSNFRAVKRPVDAVRVLAAVTSRRPARLALVGEGPEMAAVWSEAERLDVRERLCALGNRVDVQPILACGDVLLLPSEEESFGLAALEALACGVPAVTSDAGGLTELIEDRQSYCVPVGDTDGMAARVLEIVADATTLSRHRIAARRRAQQFDAERIIPLYEQLYRRVLA
jgi:N-acetyl-alpha-D-glucosaminyl L-malate synthase BshA